MAKDNIAIENSAMEDSIRMYLNEINRCPRLSIEEQKELAKKGDIDTLTKSCLPLVVSIAKTFTQRVCHLSLLDLIQEGNIGLIKAANTYDPKKGAFTTYATKCIKQEILKSIILNEDEIRISFDLKKLVREYKQLIENNPSIKEDEICLKLGITKARLYDIKMASQREMVSLNLPVGDEQDELGDLILDEDNIDVIDELFDLELKVLIKNNLSPLYYYIFYNRYLSSNLKTLNQLKDDFNFTKEGIRQIEKKALKKVKNILAGKNEGILLKDLKKAVKGNLEYYRIEPIKPTDIIKYLFIKDDLEEIELKYFILKTFGKYYLSDEMYTKLLGISFDELHSIKKDLWLKLVQLNEQNEIYENFKNEMINKYGSSIYNLGIYSTTIYKKENKLKKCIK